MNRQWYLARLRWAVLAEQEGLRHWRESSVLFRGWDEREAFAKALKIGRSQEGVIDEGDQTVITRLAAVVTLDWLGSELPETVEIGWQDTVGEERLPVDHRFEPERRWPPPTF